MAGGEPLHASPPPAAARGSGEPLYSSPAKDDNASLTTVGRTSFLRSLQSRLRLAMSNAQGARSPQALWDSPTAAEGDASDLNRRPRKVRVRALLMMASVIVALSACHNPPDASCYRVFESVVTENNGRFLMEVPCPPGQRGVITSGP